MRRLQHVEPSRACDDGLPFAVGRACASALASLCEMKLVGDIAVEARHQHIRQIIDRSYGLSSLRASDPAIADPGPRCTRRSGGRARRTRKATARAVRRARPAAP